MTTTTTITIDAVDAIEITEALHWLTDWLRSDPQLETSMRRFTAGFTGINETVADLDRFAATLEGVTL